MTGLSVTGANYRRSLRLRPALAPGILVGGGLYALTLAFLLVHRSAVAAVALVLLPPTVWFLTRSYGGLTLGLVILLVLPYWDTIGTVQLSVLRLASTAALASFLVTRRVRLTSIDFALLVFVVILILGWAFQYDQPGSGRVLSQELTPLGFYLGARAIPWQRAPVVMTVTLLAGAVGALTVLYEYWLGHSVFKDPTAYVWNATTSTIFRPGGIFGSPPGAATVLCFVVLFGLAALSCLSGRLKVLAWACLSISSLALLLTFTRTDIAAVGVGAVAFLWLVRSRLLRPLRVAWFAVGGVLLVLVLLPILQTSTTFQEGILRPGTLAARESYWTDALPIVTASTHNLLLGVGSGALEAPAINAKAPIASDVATTPQVYTNSLHSEYVTTLVEQGVIGLGALFLFLLSAAVAAARASRRSHDAVCAALSASIVAMAIVMAADTTLLHGPSSAILMVAAGLTANAVSTRRRPTMNFGD